jgi:hypothetical protein
MSSEPGLRFEDALRWGLARTSVQSALDEHERRPDPMRCVHRLEQVTRLGVPAPAFADPDTMRRIEEVYRQAKAPQPANIRALELPASPVIGRAAFPLHAEHQSRPLGLLRWIRVGTFPYVDPSRQPRDPAAHEAVEAGRAAAKLHFPQRGAGLDDLQWRIEPELESNQRVVGASLGLAAFIAFVSRALHAEVPPTHVFTGVIDGAACTPVPEDSIPTKLRALEECPQLHTFICPGHPGRRDDDLLIYGQQLRLLDVVSLVFEAWFRREKTLDKKVAEWRDRSWRQYLQIEARCLEAFDTLQTVPTRPGYRSVRPEWWQRFRVTFAGWLDHWVDAFVARASADLESIGGAPGPSSGRRGIAVPALGEPPETADEPRALERAVRTQVLGQAQECRRALERWLEARAAA